MAIVKTMKTRLNRIAMEALRMKFQAITAVVLLMFTCLQSANAYSAFWSIDGWDEAKLKEAGITITILEHEQVGQIGDLDWVQITYDTSKLQEDQDVLMVMQIVGENNELVSAYRADRKKGDARNLRMTFAVPKEQIGGSHLMVFLTKNLSDVAGRERKSGGFGDPGFGGYTMSMARIMELARKSAVGKPGEKPSKE